MKSRCDYSLTVKVEHKGSAVRDYCVFKLPQPTLAAFKFLQNSVHEALPTHSLISSTDIDTIVAMTCHSMAKRSIHVF